jgi:hypothetical protein
VDLALQPGDAVAEALDRRRQHALLLLGGRDLFLLLVDAVGQGRADPGQREHEIGHQAQGDWEPKALLHSSSASIRASGVS